jgi:hypothetical protein
VRTEKPVATSVGTSWAVALSFPTQSDYLQEHDRHMQLRRSKGSKFANIHSSSLRTQ